jgi:hypothetical protein
MSTMGISQRHTPGQPLLHLYQTTLSVQRGSISLPPKGVFDWHYLQCVIKRFGTPQYQMFPGIKFFAYPFATDSDGPDDGSENDENDTPWPSYHFDQYVTKQGRRHVARERNISVAQWSLNVISGI